MVEGYCMRCKARNKMNDPVITKTAKGGFMAKGTCSACPADNPTKMCAMMSKDTAEAAISSGEAKKGY